MPVNSLTDGQRGDETTTVVLTRRDEEALRQMIDGYRSSGIVWRWFRNVGIVFASGVITLFAFWDQIRHALGIIK